jgi:hypothetical protein
MTNDANARTVTELALGIGAMLYPMLDYALNHPINVTTAIGGCALVWLNVCLRIKELRKKDPLAPMPHPSPRIPGKRGREHESL